MNQKQSGDGGDIHQTSIAIQEYADRFGIEPERVRYKAGLARLRELGIFVGLSVHGTSMFNTTVKWEELGIPLGDVRRSRLGKGGKRLLPKELSLTSIEVRLRQCLNRHGLNLDIGLHGVRWLSADAYTTWRREHDDLVALFETRKGEILDERATTLEWLRHQFTEVAEVSYVTLRNLRRREARQTALNAPVHTPQTTADLARLPMSHWDTEDEPQRREEFIEAIVGGVVARYPSQEQIAEELRVDYYCPLLLSQADREADRQAAEEHRAQAELSRLATNAAYIKAASASRKRRLEIEAAQAKAAAIQKVEIAAARERMAELGNPFEDALMLLRGEVNEKLLGVLDTIQRRGYIHGKSALALENTLERFGNMRSLGDDELAAELEKVRQSADKTATGGRDTQAVMNALTSAIQLTADAAWEAKKQKRLGMRAALLDF